MLSKQQTRILSLIGRYQNDELWFLEIMHPPIRLRLVSRKFKASINGDSLTG